jgi:hypothetical protein
MYATYRGAHAKRGSMTESSERSLRAERRGKRLKSTRRRRLRTGREATLRSDEHRATGAASGGAAQKRRAPGNRGGERMSTSFEAPSRRLAGGHGQRGTGRVHGAPQLLPRNHSVRRRQSDEGTGNRVSVNGARALVRATGAESSFGNGGRFADKTDSGRHRRRATGGGASGNGTGQPETGPQRASPAMPSGTTGDV